MKSKLHATLAGEDNPGAILTETDVITIRERRSQGDTLKAIASDYGVHLSTIDLTVRGVSWPDVGGPVQPTRHRRPRRCNMPNARLYTEDILRIRRRHAAGQPKAELAMEYGVSVRHVSRIVRGDAWARVVEVAR